MKGFLLFWIILIIIPAGLVFYIKENSGFSADSAKIFVSPFLPPQEATLLFAGDIMTDRGVEEKIKKHGSGDYNFPFLKIKNFIQKGDLAFANLEGPVSDKGVKVGSIYSFRMDPGTAEAIKNSGFSIVSLANNHMFDYQRISLEETMRRLEKSGVSYAGAGFSREEAYGLKIEEAKGIKIGFLAYTNLAPPSWQAKEESSGIARITELTKEIEEDIKNAGFLCDILVVSLHSGTEYSPLPNSFQEKFAKGAIDAGADIVAGHHPHVAQPVEKYNGGWIFYSLGNFVFDQGFSKETMESVITEVSATKEGIKKVASHKVKINEFFQPELTGQTVVHENN